jgi:hypothetical protein
MCGKGASHQTAVSPSRMRFGVPLHVMMGSMGLTDQTLGQCGAIRGGDGGKRRRRRGDITDQTAPHRV